MCLAAWCVARSPRFPWVLATNRDEFHDRAATPMAWWQPAPGAPMLLSGRDLAGGGTWMGLRRDGRLALLTNVREPGRFDAGLPSRGALVVDALCAPDAGLPWLQQAAAVPRNGFNLVLADLAGAHFSWAANHPPALARHGAGVWGLSNAALDTPWPKVATLKQQLDEAVRHSASLDALLAAAFSALASRSLPADAQLPATGVPLLRERQLAPAFIHIAPDAGLNSYGTRCSTVCVVEQGADTRWLTVVERSFAADGEVAGEVMHRFELGSA